MKNKFSQPLAGIYQDLCTLLYDAMHCLRTTDFMSEEAETAIQKTETILSFFEYQTAIEEALLFSTVHDYEPMIEAILRDDHRKRTKYIVQLQQLIASHYEAAGTTATLLFGSRLIRMFNEFAIVCTQQMHSHETMLAPVLCRYYTQSEIAQIELSITGSQPALSSLSSALTYETLTSDTALI